MPSQPEKIAILGGGPAALAAAYELTLSDGWSDRYQITVYQTGWRLGGKGASGRNAQSHDRIEEHGLHVWPGFYDNAFRMMRHCYRELGRPTGIPIRDWDDAFQPLDHLAVEEFLGGMSEHWLFTAHRNSGMPGDERPLPSLWVLASRVMATIRSAIDAIDSASTGEHDLVHPRSKAAPVRRVLSKFMGRAAIDNLLAHIAKLNAGPPQIGLLESMLEHALDAVRAWQQSREEHLARVDSTLRRLWIYVDLAATSLRGMLVDRVFRNGLDPLDAKDFRTWLKLHGASQATIDSAIVRGLYSFVFATVGDRPDLGAGSAIRLSLRTGFAYQGAIMYKMLAGMGDVVFAPLYEYLRRRGVQFQFFHRVRKLTLSADRASIASIELGRQATLKSGEYDPLVPVHNLPCWPDRPRYDQLVEGEQLRHQNVDLESCWSGWADVARPVLQPGVDFDRIVLGISLGALPKICSELAAAFPPWQDLLTKVPTVATGAAQLWWSPTLANLAWSTPSPVLTAFELPFDTWADMSQTLAAEAWSPPSAPKSVAYLCGTIPDPATIPDCETANDFPEVQRAALRESVRKWMEQSAPRLWPAIVDTTTGQIRWELLDAAPGMTGPARLDTQYWRANFEPSGRYVQSPAGSLRHRLRPSESGIGNLVLAGDWTRNGINVGCIEAAVISGMRAARVIQDNDTPLPGEFD